MQYALIIRTKDGKEHTRWFSDREEATRHAGWLRARRDDLDWISLLTQTCVF
jgi:hypothetical protein